MAERFERLRYQQCARSHPGGCERRFGAGMAAADDDDVKAVQVFIHGVIAQARAGTEVSPARPSWPRRETRLTPSLAFAHAAPPACRSEERRVGKEWGGTFRYRGSPYH